MIFQEELGIPFAEARDMLEYLDPRPGPVAEKQVINERWYALRSGHGASGPR